MDKINITNITVDINNSQFDEITRMLYVVTDIAVFIADGNWGITSIRSYVDNLIPDCQYKEAIADVLGVLLKRRPQHNVSDILAKEIPMTKFDHADEIAEHAMNLDKDSLYTLMSCVSLEIKEINKDIEDNEKRLSLLSIINRECERDRLLLRNKDLYGIQCRLENDMDKIKDIIRLIDPKAQFSK